MKPFNVNYLVGIIGVIAGIWGICIYEDILDKIGIGILVLGLIIATLVEVKESKQQ